MKTTITHLQRSTLSNHYYHLYKYRYRLQQPGQPQQVHEREVYHRGNGATVLLYNSMEQTILLVRQFRLPAFVNEHPTGILLEACAGQLQPGEQPHQAMQRELAEETGYVVPELQWLFELYSTPGSVSEKMYYFAANCTRSMQVFPGGGATHEGEHTELVAIPYREVVHYMYNGTIQDAKTIILLQYALLNGIIPALGQ